MKTAPQILGALAVLSLTLSASPRAHACWDGYHASVRRVTVGVPGDSDWNPATARAAARWGMRIDALLPPGTILKSYFGYATLCAAGKDGACGTTLAEIEWKDGGLSDLFTKVAAAMGASPAEVKHARAQGAAPLTFQVFAARSETRANAFAGRINAAGLGGIDGFYVAGGFPAVNPTAHAVPGVDARGRKIFRVLVGAFLSRAEAVAGGAELKKETGIDGFARAL